MDADLASLLTREYHNLQERLNVHMLAVGRGDYQGQAINDLTSDVDDWMVDSLALVDDLTERSLARAHKYNRTRQSQVDRLSRSMLKLADLLEASANG